MVTKDIELTEEQQRMLQVDDGWYDITPKGLKVMAVPTFEQWEKLGFLLAYLEESLAKAIGDWVNLGEGSFGERYSQVLDVFGEKSYGHVANCASVMRRVPYDRRIGNLSFSHLQVVAPLDPDDQIYWQERAIEENLTAEQLREEINPPEPPRFIEVVTRNRDSVGRVMDKASDFPGGITEEEINELTLAYNHLNRAISIRKNETETKIEQ